ncbi:MAG: DUF3459 domain-containing protein [Bacteroidia bacterium]|nr:DUF3459 domain-containing protein [Bacteroidia bacterium]
MKKSLFTFALLILSFYSYSQKFVPKEKLDSLPINDRDNKSRITYDVFVRSYFDSNKDGNGDLNGLISKLSYIYNLGAEAVSLSSLNPSSSFDNFDVTDFYKIDSIYGDSAGFEKLVSEAHKLHLKVIINLQLNHCSTKHPWFLDAMKGKTSKYHDYFIWKDEKSITTDKDKWYFPVDKKGKNIQGPKYYSYFGGKTVDLNFNNQSVRDEVIKIGKYWLTTFGVDALKIDGPQAIFSENDESKNLEWWNDFHKEMKKVNSNFYLIGDIYNTDNQPYLKNGIDATYNYELSSAINSAVINGADSGLVERLVKHRSIFSQESPGFVDITFIANEKQDRIMSNVDGDIEKAKLAASILFTLPGSPLIFYGEEMGMKGQKPKEFINEPFLWSSNAKKNGITNWEKSKYNSVEDVKPLRIQRSDSSSIISHYKKLIRLRRTSSALSGEGLVQVKVPESGILVFMRSSSTQKVLVIHNLSPKDVSSEIELPGLVGEQLFQIGSVLIEGKTLICAPYSSAVFLVK